MIRNLPPSRAPILSNLLKEAHFPIPRITTRVSFGRHFFICQAKSVGSLDSSIVSSSLSTVVDGSLDSSTVSSSLSTAVKEEATAVLEMLLEKRRLNNSSVARAINLPDHFVEYLVSRIHSAYKTHSLVGRDISTLEIKEKITLYLESLLEEYGDSLVDVVENFSKSSGKERPSSAPQSSSLLDKEGSSLATRSPRELKRLKLAAQLCEVGPDGQYPPQTVYLLELGVELEQIRTMVLKFPSLAHHSLEERIKPVVEFLLELGVNQSEIPSILRRRPQMLGVSISEKFLPMMAYLETMGVDKKQWAKVIYKSSGVLTYSKQKVKANVDFLYELGLTAEMVGRVITRFPHILNYSVEGKLRPTAEYFMSMGVDLVILLCRAPYVFGLNMEGNLKPVTEFFLEKGFSIEEVGSMVSRYGQLYTYSLVENIIPKWEFFLTLDYPKSDLVKFPMYFGYSLEKRIKPRFQQVMESGLKLSMNQVLCDSKPEFDKVLKKKMMKKIDEEHAPSE